MAEKTSSNCGKATDNLCDMNKCTLQDNNKIVLSRRSEEVENDTITVCNSGRKRWNNYVAKICSEAHNNAISYENNLQSNTTLDKFTNVRKKRFKRKRNSIEDFIFQQRMLLHIYCQKMMLYRYQRSIAAIKRNPSVRITWISYAGNMSDKLFRRRFRMTKDCFILLCRKIAKGVGEEEFNQKLI